LESRILRITEALEQWSTFDRIFVVGMQTEGRPQVQTISDRRQLILTRPWMRSSPRLVPRLARFLSWYIVTIWRFGREPVACVNCHSLSTLPLGWLLKRISGAKLIYDPHELETETLGMRGMRRVLAKWTEAIFIRSADAVVVVGPKIAEWYASRYAGIAPATIRNLPKTPYQPQRSNLFRERLGIPNHELVFFYQGLLEESRGVDLTLAAFARVPKNRHVAFLGSGRKESAIRACALKHPNIHFLPAVRPEEVRNYTRSGDVGLCLIEPDCLSYYYSLPNKLFEYVVSGVPVIATKLPELSAIAETAGCGWTVDNDPEALAELVSNISDRDIAERRRRCVEWALGNTWEKECETLKLIYGRLGFAAPAA
jgi:glycosyltransferase involved in cell wall biosynthesis